MRTKGECVWVGEGGGKLRNGFLHTYLHSTQMVYEKIIDQTLIGLHTDSSYQA